MNTAAEPMDRLNDALNRAADALRDAMHAIHDVDPATARPGDWYNRIWQLHTITDSTGDLLDMTASRVRRLSAGNLYTTDGSDVTERIVKTCTKLHDAEALLSRTNGLANEAWSEIGVVAVRTGGGER